jgi:hypothetical protein
MGSAAGRTYPKDSPLADRLCFRLFVLVHAVRAAIVTQALVCDRVTDLGPFELIVAVHMPEGAILNGFAPGWERAEYAFEVTTALQAHPVIREEVEPWPVDAEGQHDLLGESCGSPPWGWLRSRRNSAWMSRRLAGSRSAQLRRAAAFLAGAFELDSYLNGHSRTVA